MTTNEADRSSRLVSRVLSDELQKRMTTEIASWQVCRRHTETAPGETGQPEQTEVMQIYAGGAAGPVAELRRQPKGTVTMSEWTGEQTDGPLAATAPDTDTMAQILYVTALRQVRETMALAVAADTPATLLAQVLASDTASLMLARVIEVHAEQMLDLAQWPEPTAMAEGQQPEARRQAEFLSLTAREPMHLERIAAELERFIRKDQPGLMAPGEDTGTPLLQQHNNTVGNLSLLPELQRSSPGAAAFYRHTVEGLPQPDRTYDSAAHLLETLQAALDLSPREAELFRAYGYPGVPATTGSGELQLHEEGIRQVQARCRLLAEIWPENGPEPRHYQRVHRFAGHRNAREAQALEAERLHPGSWTEFREACRDWLQRQTGEKGGEQEFQNTLEHALWCVQNGRRPPTGWPARRDAAQEWSSQDRRLNAFEEKEAFAHATWSTALQRWNHGDDSPQPTAWALTSGQLILDTAPDAWPHMKDQVPRLLDGSNQAFALRTGDGPADTAVILLDRKSDGQWNRMKRYSYYTVGNGARVNLLGDRLCLAYEAAEKGQE